MYIHTYIHTYTCCSQVALRVAESPAAASDVVGRLNSDAVKMASDVGAVACLSCVTIMIIISSSSMLIVFICV